jgi:hypothetical protein
VTQHWRRMAEPEWSRQNRKKFGAIQVWLPLRLTKVTSSAPATLPYASETSRANLP